MSGELAILLLMGPLNMDYRGYSKIAGRVKGLILALVLTMWFANFAEALGANLTLGWDPSPDAQVAGYKVYYGVPGGPKYSLNVGNTTQGSLANLMPGATYEIFVTAYDGVGSESTPSNAISYTVPNDTIPLGAYKLGISGFKDGFVQVSPKGAGDYGNYYAAGTLVTLTATAKSGGIFSGWTINGIQYPQSQVTITIAADTMATPVFKSATGAVVSGDSLGGISMSIQKSGGQGYLNIGGEAGAWVLEMTNDFKVWSKVASGITSDKVPLNLAAGNSFFRLSSVN